MQATFLFLEKHLSVGPCVMTEAKDHHKKHAEPQPFNACFFPVHICTRALD
jgi:hypothetical protein